MAAPSLPQIPAPLSNPAFLRASHFQLGYDRRPEGKTVVSPYRTDYPPRWGTFCPPPVHPPKCAGVLNQDMHPSWDARSEMEVSYPPWPLQPRPEIHPPASQIWMHVDPQQPTPTSVTRQSYPYPSGLLSTPPRRVDKWEDSVPSGDTEKQALPESLCQQSYRPPSGVSPPTKAPSQHLGEDATLKGDGRHRFDTSYKSQYTGKSGSPAQRYKEKVDSVPFGDPRCRQTNSEQKRSYVPWPLEGQRYDAKMAAAQIHQTNVRPGDGQRRFSTITSESYPWKEPGPPFIPSFRSNESSILRGDRDARRRQEDITNHWFYYREPKAEDLIPQVPRKHEATLCLGDNQSTSFSTTQQSDYLPPPAETQRVESKKMDLLKSNIPFNYRASDAPTTTAQDMLVSHQLRKNQLTEEELQKVKYSHLIYPWRDRRWFSTEYKDKFTDKYGGPILLAMGDSQKSSVPLGTVANYQRRSKIPS